MHTVPPDLSWLSALGSTSVSTFFSFRKRLRDHICKVNSIFLVWSNLGSCVWRTCCDVEACLSFASGASMPEGHGKVASCADVCCGAAHLAFQRSSLRLAHC